MKKSIILIICLLSTINLSSASFWSPSSLDLYKNIDKWIDELSGKMKTFELNWWPKESTINQEVNNLAIIEWKQPCLDSWKEISQNQFDDIVLNDSIEDLVKFIDQKCINKDWVVAIETLDSTLKLLQKHNINTKKIADKKTDQIYKISNIWLYSDWMIENSWFDLISDIIDINFIIFKNDVEYIWWEAVEIDTIIDSFIEKLNKDWVVEDVHYESETNYSPPNNSTQSSSNISNDTVNDDTNNNTYWSTDTTNVIDEDEDINNYEDSLVDTDNNYICPDDTNNSWLFNNESDSIIYEIQKETYDWSSLVNEDSSTWWWTTWSSSWDSNTSTINSSWNWNDSLNSNWVSNPNVELEWEYIKVVDNSEWPCDDFFCIDIEFKMYQHNLFWSWDNITIEYLINRSNEHLKKYASTSLIQSKMSTNNFEIWLSNFNLPDLFHLSIQISTKPVPILNIEPEWKQDKSEFSSKSMLEEYYKQNGMDYTRRNDLDLATNMEQDKQSIINSDMLWILNPVKKKWEHEEDFLNKGSKKIEYINKSIEKKVSYWITETFELEYAEIDKFTVSINEYVKNLYSVLKEMDKIPVVK